MYRSADAPRAFAQRALAVLSWTGLAVSLLTLAISAPHLLAIGGGAGVVLGNAAQFAWTIGLLAIAFAWTRSIGWRALAGAALAGFFGVASLTVLAGKPLVDRLGNDSPFVVLLFAPFTEELLKLLPEGLFVLFAARGRRRSSIGDITLFGFTVASGFAVYENILYARGTDGGWFTTLPLSALLPSIAMRGPMLAGGHAVYTGLASLGLAVTIMYGRRFRAARFALPAALVLVIMEHATVNHLSSLEIFGVTVGEPSWWAQIFLLLTLHGYLSSLLLLGGVVAAAIFEARFRLQGRIRFPAAIGAPL